MDDARVAPQGWAADTTRPLGPIPLVFAAVCAAVIATVFTNAPVVPPVAWTAFAVLSLILAVRAVRWILRQVEAAQFERQMNEILERQPRLVPLFRPPRDVSADHPGFFHKAS